MTVRRMIGLKAGSASGAEQAAEKLENLGETGEKHTSGPKGRVGSVAFTPGMNPRPTSKQGFSAACKAQ